MDWITILAFVKEGEIPVSNSPAAEPAVSEVAASTATATSSNAEIMPIDWIWGQITALNVLEALTFIAFGAVCLLYGWRVFKVLVVISFALLGLLAGMLLSDIILGAGNNPVLGVLLGLVLAIVSVPMMRWSVCVLGAVAGGIITASLWYAFELPEEFIWAGGLVGVVAGGMISFIVFRIAVMLFSCLGGSALAVMGFIAFMYMYPLTTGQVQDLVLTQKWFLPVAVLIPAAMGVFFQNKFIKGSKDWTV